MLNWISSNSEWLNVISNWTMVAIWIAYLQVFLRSFRRQTLPKIVINQAAGSSLDAACFVSNMSSDAIYMESVIVDVKTDSQSLACTVTDFGSYDGQQGAADPKQRTFQGPLPPSEYTSLGSFEYLIDTAARRTGRDGGQLKRSAKMIAVTVTILADYASETLLIGAKRTFTARADNDWKLSAETFSTEQIRSARERKRIYATLRRVE